MEIIVIIAISIITGVLSILLRWRRVIKSLSIFASAVVLFESINIALKVSASGSYSPFVLFSIDSLGAIVMLLIACIGFVTTIYSIQYFREETAKGIIGFTRVRQYFALLNIFLAAMFLVITANSPIFAWISIEVTSLSTAFLISFYNKPSAIEGAWKYLIINSIGLLLGFFGTLLYFASVSSFGGNEFISWQLLTENAVHLDPAIAKIAFVFVLIGYGTKVGFAPMHTWKPDAYSKAPNPIGTLLSGALMPVAFIIILKFKAITDSIVGPQFSQHLLIIFGLLSIAVAALIMFSARNYKRVLAYSGIENAGVIALGFGFGGLGIFAAVMHLVYHSLVKGIMFFSSGNLLLKYNSSKIMNVKGALRAVPITSVLFITGFLIVTGIPPFGIFLTKMQILAAGMQTYPVVSIVALFFMTLVFIGFLKHVTTMFFGEKPADMEKGGESIWLVLPSIILLVIIVVLSFSNPPPLAKLINDAVLHN